MGLVQWRRATTDIEERKFPSDNRNSLYEIADAAFVEY